MRQAFDMSKVRRTLRSMVEKGYLTVEDLDQPSPYTRENFKQWHVRYVNPLRNGGDMGPTVEVQSPRDLPYRATGVTPAQRSDLPLTLEAGPF